MLLILVVFACFRDQRRTPLSRLRMQCPLRRLAALAIASILAALSFAVSAQNNGPLRIVAIGDSLVAGYGLDVEYGFTAQLERALQQKGHAVKIHNAGVSGDTTDGGLARVDWVLSEPASAVILFLGYNDAFRVIPVELVRSNLAQTIEKIQSRNLPILLAGAKAPRNLGAQYYDEFDAIYPDLANRFGVLLYPFFLEGIATEPAFNQEDGIHPNAAGVAVIVEQMLPFVEQLIDQALEVLMSDQ